MDEGFWVKYGGIQVGLRVRLEQILRLELRLRLEIGLKFELNQSKIKTGL